MIYPQPKPKRQPHAGEGLEKQCMRLWGEIVRIRAGGHCEYCGTSDQVQAHHVFTRSTGRTKYDPDNGCLLCSGHHFFVAHKNPLKFKEWLTEKRGQTWWTKLRMAANVRGKIDLKLLKIWLENEKADAIKRNHTVYTQM